MKRITLQLKEFRKINNLSQTELGEYLGVKKAFISRIENGVNKLPEEKLTKLLSNDRGWDISALEGDSSVNLNVVGSNNSGKVSQSINARCKTIAEQEKQIAELEALLSAKVQENEWLRSLVEKYITKRTD